MNCEVTDAVELTSPDAVKMAIMLDITLSVSHLQKNRHIKYFVMSSKRKIVNLSLEIHLEFFVKMKQQRWTGFLKGIFFINVQQLHLVYLNYNFLGLI